MADLGITGLKNEVDVQIYTNHAQAITGAIMNDTLIDTIDTLKNGGNLDAKSVDTAQLADGAVEALQINTGAVTEAKIATDAVETAKIKDLAVTGDKIATGAVTHAKIGADAVDDSNIQDGSITESKIYEGSINEGHLQMNCVTEEKIATDAVTEAKIEASAVTNTKIGSGAVTEAKIGSGAVTESKIGAKAVTNSKIGDKAVDTLQLADGAVKALQIGSGAVETAKIKDLNVTTSKLAAKNVTSEKLADDAIVRTFAGAVLLNPYSASLTPRRVGDIAINTTSGEIWQAIATTNEAASWELQPSVAYVEVVKENVDSINVDNLGDVRAKSIDMDELPKVCDFPMYIISTTAPNVVPDFVSQHWIDTVAKKVYIAVGVSSAADFVVLN